MLKMMPSVVGDVVRSVGLSTAMRAAGVVTGLLPIPQPMLLVGPGSRLATRTTGALVATLLTVHVRTPFGPVLPVTVRFADGRIALVGDR